MENQNNTRYRLTESFIESARSVQLSNVISRFVKLKKKGTNYTGCCPFHSEKTASFSVNDTKGIYKCFGCGVSGDGLKFMIEYEKQTFYEACISVAEIAGLQVEYETTELTQAEKEKLSAKEAQEQVLNFVIPVYRKKLLELPADHPAKAWLQQRNITDELINEFNLGWAGEDWHFITPMLINSNQFTPAAALGIIKRSKDGESNFDGYRNRITFPITDRRGRFIGMGGRYIQTNDKEDATNIPKYINPTDCEIYNKSAVLYGLSKAAKTIKETCFAIVTEGYMDVISPHRAGFTNVVCTCGTAFTTQQMLLLKKYTNRVAMWRDNDKAGAISFNQALPGLLQHGFQVDVIIYEGKDPDEFIQVLTPDEKGIFSLPEMKDALLHRVTELWSEAAEDLHKKATAKTVILELIANISNDILRENYLDELIKKYKWKGTDVKKQFKNIVDVTAHIEDNAGNEQESILPAWVSEDQRNNFEETGYISVNRKHNGKPMVGYYGFSNSSKTQITNFLVTPLFHVYAGQESRYLIEVYNGYRRGVLDVPAKVIPSVDQFQAATVTEGNFLIYGAKAQWLRVAADILQSFQRCIELNSLGWQRFGFYAWVNKIYIPGEGLKDLDNWGIIKHEDENFLVPASCEAYRQLQRTGEDPFENDRYLTYLESPVNFEVWAKQMKTVFAQKGIVGVAYSILSLFRDIIFEVDNNCPHLYAFGEPSSGKSKFAESITALFYFKRSAFNLNSGTDFAFFNYMQRYNNAPAHLNEFDIEVIRPEWFQALKGIYDGEGRERGKGGSKNRTEVMRVRSTLVLTGQKLITADDNSIVTRSLVESFSVEEYTDKRKKEYDKLKDWERVGMSSMLIELLQHRKFFQENYKDQYNYLLSFWRKNNNAAALVNQRIMQNYAHLATCYKMMSGFIGLPQSAEDFTAYCFAQAIYWSKFIRNSDTLSEFWRTVEFLFSQQQITEGWDYIVEDVFSVKVRVNRDEIKDHSFEQPTKVLFLRINTVHKLFQRTYKLNTGKEAMNIDNLLHYFSSRKYYIGPVKSKIFSRFRNSKEFVTRQDHNGVDQKIAESAIKDDTVKTSCYAFIYDDLDISISSNFQDEISQKDNLGEKLRIDKFIELEQELPFPLKKALV